MNESPTPVSNQSPSNDTKNAVVSIAIIGVIIAGFWYFRQPSIVAADKVIRSANLKKGSYTVQGCFVYAAPAFMQDQQEWMVAVGSPNDRTLPGITFYFKERPNVRGGDYVDIQGQYLGTDGPTQNGTRNGEHAWHIFNNCKLSQ